MSFFVTKTILAVLFVAAGLTAALSMLTLMGKSERKMSVGALKITHRVAGYTFAALLVLLAVMGLLYLSSAGDALSFRGVLHWSVASLLVFVVALKLVVVRWFRQFLKFAPVMGMIIITLALVVTMLSAVFFAVTGGFAKPVRKETSSAEVDAGAPVELVSVDEPVSSAEPATTMTAPPSEPPSASPAVSGVTSASADTGQPIFGKYCSGCHYDDSTDRKIGPGLAGLFSRDTFAADSRRVSIDSVREQIIAPEGGMPSFKAFLSSEQVDDLIAYLETI